MTDLITIISLVFAPIERERKEKPDNVPIS